MSRCHVKKPVVLTVISGGGFTFETTLLLQALSVDFEILYLKTPFGGKPGEAGLPNGRAFAVPSFATITQNQLFKSISACVVTFVRTFYLLVKNDVGIVIVVGCSHAVPMFLASRLLGRKTAFIESITRVRKLSLTGTVIYKLRLATIFLIQWQTLSEQYPNSRLGSIL